MAALRRGRPPGRSGRDRRHHRRAAPDLLRVLSALIAQVLVLELAMPRQGHKVIRH